MEKWLVPFGFALVLVSSVPAASESPTQSGFSARVEAGVLWLNTTDQFTTDDKNKQSGGLGGSAEAFQQVHPVVLFDLRYMFASSATQVYLGTPLEGGDFPLSLGAVRQFPDGSALDVALITPLTTLFSTVWKDPYLVGEDREETPSREYGVRASYGHVLGSGFGGSCKVTRTDVDADEIGQRFEGLRRDGVTHELGVEYGLETGSGLVVTPRVEYTRGAMEGDANSFVGWGAGLTFQQYRKSHILQVFLSAGRRDYDAEHPVFTRTRREEGYSAMGLVTLTDLFGSQHLFSDVIAGYALRQANISFFDARTWFAGLTIGYRL